MNSPSGDHVGLQSVGTSDVTGTGSPPSAGMTQTSISARSDILAVKAIQRPSGDHVG